ncbi:hypothetical protein PF005_g18974 [Phytophthora fragariae]|uniref:Uncharacterized protein n=1 Tax=Phytophthora fragariae TaxID=53985 RepID=A0A6A3SGK4_9STRA|nr:hypothetical protein PF009_g10868 [Phytophthora fragariae]KAE9013344.1 hypothetical protein PF011_g8522 [Phytophthora fragariae]KAE9116267.1 hypothetical protein PF007_g9720 [Phytophthora fragariae]KAE9117194.1 hypothetical protein PF010_g8697 [Phytophthora fragariae]KAE9146167.1 hypothetical protein PF006_g9044 [Phytophthora fragariae]
MSASIGFGEYEALLPCDGVNAALTFSREFFSREYVVQRVTRLALTVAVNENEKLWRGLSRIHSGHVVVSIDNVPVRGLSSRQFAELWYPPVTSNAVDQTLLRYRRVRFRDRKRAELEVEMQKDWAGSRPVRFTPVQDDAELQTKLRDVHTLIWEHELSQANAVLRSLPVGSDPMVCLLAVEMEVVRVLVSKDVLYAKQAQRAANQAVTWLEKMCELSSLSYSTRKQTQLALAEALFLSALLRLGGDQRLAAIATARRCASIYVELEDKFLSNPDSTKRDRLLVPESELQVFKKRVRFGTGILHVGGALALQSALDWIGTLLKGACDIKSGVEYLLDCGRIDEGNDCHLQANWTALAFTYSSSVLRLVRQRHEQNIGDEFARAIGVCQQSALQRHPKAILFLWSQANATNFGGDRLKQLEAELSRVSALEERAHVVRFDLGYRHFLAREFDRSSAQLRPICKCTSAPSKLRGLSSLFIAVGYLLTTDESGALDVKLLNSVRLLLRSARRFLAIRLEDSPEDFEAGALHERLGAYLDGGDEYLLLLPWEILYVYCQSTKTIMIGSTVETCQQQHHLVALEKITQLSKRTRVDGDKSNHEAELCLFRAIIRFNLRELDACEKELQTIWSELLPQGSRPRTNSAFSRLLSQRTPHPPPASVAPVAWFYQLRLLLERRCSRPTLRAVEQSTPNSALSPNCSKMDTPPQAGAEKQTPYPYHHVYSGKLQALSKLVARLANEKVDNNISCSSPTACNT